MIVHQIVSSPHKIDRDDFKHANNLTIASYDKDAQQYLENTPTTLESFDLGMKQWIDQTLTLTEQGACILEVGSGLQRDSSYMKNKGFKVLCSDASSELLSRLRAEGSEAIYFNVLEDHLDTKFDLIFANAVVPHFTMYDLAIALRNIRYHLQGGGIFSFSAKKGLGETWITEKGVSPRYTKYWSEDDLPRLLIASGYKILFKNSNPGHLPGHFWINIIAQKVG